MSRRRRSSAVAGRPAAWYGRESWLESVEDLPILDAAISGRPHWAEFRYKRAALRLAQDDVGGAAADFTAAFDLERWTLGTADLRGFRTLGRTLLDRLPDALRPDIRDFLAAGDRAGRLAWARAAADPVLRLKRLLDVAVEDERPHGRAYGDADILTELRDLAVRLDRPWFARLCDMRLFVETLTYGRRASGPGASGNGASPADP